MVMPEITESMKKRVETLEAQVATLQTQVTTLSGIKTVFYPVATGAMDVLMGTPTVYADMPGVLIDAHGEMAWVMGMLPVEAIEVTELKVVAVLMADIAGGQRMRFNVGSAWAKNCGDAIQYGCGPDSIFVNGPLSIMPSEPILCFDTCMGDLALLISDLGYFGVSIQGDSTGSLIPNVVILGVMIKYKII